jgi:hypothetical protein
VRRRASHGRPLAGFWKSREIPWIVDRHLGGRAMYAIALDIPA